MEAAILVAETRVTELEAMLNDPDFHATRSREARDLVAQMEQGRAAVEKLYARWQELDQIGKKTPA